VKGWPIAILAALFLWGRRKVTTKATVPDEAWASVALQESQSGGFPGWYILATADVESGMKARGPTGSGRARTFYPFGITIYRARDYLRGYTDEEITEVLKDPVAQTQLVAEVLNDSWKRYGPNVDAVRMAYVLPGAAKAGQPYPAKTGSVATQRRLERWRAAVARHGGPDIRATPLPIAGFPQA